MSVEQDSSQHQEHAIYDEMIGQDKATHRGHSSPIYIPVSSCSLQSAPFGSVLQSTLSSAPFEP